MKLQLALDTVDIKTALGIIDRTVDSVDIIEIGTPMIIEYGMEAVRAVKASFPALLMLADMMCVRETTARARELVGMGVR